MANQSDIRIPWSGRGSVYTEDEIAAVVEAMRNADPQTQGRYQTEFEQRFAIYIGSANAFAVSSCTAALELSALLCRLKPGDEVVAPAHTFAASVIPFARTGARLVWADIDPETRVVTVDTIRPLITPRTKVIIVVHLYGCGWWAAAIRTCRGGRFRTAPARTRGIRWRPSRHSRSRWWRAA